MRPRPKQAETDRNRRTLFRAASLPCAQRMRKHAIRECRVCEFSLPSPRRRTLWPQAIQARVYSPAPVGSECASTRFASAFDGPWSISGAMQPQRAFAERPYGPLVRMVFRWYRGERMPQWSRASGPCQDGHATMWRERPPRVIVTAEGPHERAQPRTGDTARCPARTCLPGARRHPGRRAVGADDGGGSLATGHRGQRPGARGEQPSGTHRRSRGCPGGRRRVDGPGEAGGLAEGALAVTLENEFVDVAALEALEACGVPVFPSSRTLRGGTG